MSFIRSASVLLTACLALVAPASGQQVLKVGTGVAPFGFVDAKTNTPAGFSVEVMTAIAKDQGMQIQFVVMPVFGEMLPALVAKQIDINATSTTITPERRAMGVEFSEPYARWTEGLIVAKADQTPYKLVDELKGEVVAASVGTIYLAGLKSKTGFKEVRTIANAAQAVLAIGKNEIRGYLTASPLLAHMHKAGQLDDVRLVDTYVPAYPSIGGIAVRKEDTELLGKINAGLAKLKADGTLKAIADKWAILLP